ncbi:MAG: hypothetical protein VR65_20080 [Desulfobulbaceae bacterium BRH_c16a]|nr:MAG: hypothetical protein VR65_20080 [Desulfobulbaceae bacterium BRH_c16a]
MYHKSVVDLHITNYHFLGDIITKDFSFDEAGSSCCIIMQRDNHGLYLHFRDLFNVSRYFIFDLVFEFFLLDPA